MALYPTTLRSVYNQGEDDLQTILAGFLQQGKQVNLYPTIHGRYTVDNAWRLQQVLLHLESRETSTEYGLELLDDLHKHWKVSGDVGHALWNIAENLRMGNIVGFHMRDGYFTFVYETGEGS